jgi:retinol dehydrogenase-12
MLYPAPMGALTQLYAGTIAKPSEINGKVMFLPFAIKKCDVDLGVRCTQYLVPWARIGVARKETQNVENAKKLWDWLEDQVKDL